MGYLRKETLIVYILEIILLRCFTFEQAQMGYSNHFYSHSVVFGYFEPCSGRTIAEAAGSVLHSWYPLDIQGYVMTTDLRKGGTQECLLLFASSIIFDLTRSVYDL